MSHFVDVSPVLAAVIVEAEAQTSDDNKKGLSAAQISKKNPLAMIAVGAVLTGLLACESLQFPCSARSHPFDPSIVVHNSTVSYSSYLEYEYYLRDFPNCV